MPLRDKLPDNCTVYHGLSRNFFVARSVARSRTQLYFSQRIAAIDITIAQGITTPATGLSRNFTAFLTGAHAHTSFLSFGGALRDKLLRKLHSVTGPQHQTSETCNAKFSVIARQVTEKIAQCNRALSLQLFLKNSCGARVKLFLCHIASVT